MSVATSGEERLLHPKSPIVTKTDLKGKITYANKAFCDISGYNEEELLGQPHNMVRHPSMPREAFKDLWDSVRRGQPWQGFVKNRCKDGAYYWVNAYVTPLTENGQKVGYMSVRSVATKAQKVAAEKLYQEVSNQGKPFPYTPKPTGAPLWVYLAIPCFVPTLMALFSLLPLSSVFQWGFLGTGLTSALFGFLFINSRFRKDSRNLQQVLTHLSEGNFKFEVPTSPIQEINDTLTGFRSMQVNLRAVIADVISGATQVQHDADSLKELARDLMSRSEKQSDGISNCAAALQQLSVSVSEISDATKNSSDHANQAMSTVDEGKQSMSESTKASAMVSSVVEDARVKVETLNSAAQRINAVTKTITQIAEKTNLLALNAAIEAARAGEAGRGFAVVADEVRNLAELTRESTTEIAATVDEVQANTKDVVNTMAQAVHQVGEGDDKIRNANEQLQLIEQASRGVSTSAAEISSMLEQQRQASTEVANSMERMASLTESNVSTIRTVDESSLVLASTSDALRKLVAHFEKSL